MIENQKIHTNIPMIINIIYLIRKECNRHKSTFEARQLEGRRHNPSAFMSSDGLL